MISHFKFTDTPNGKDKSGDNEVLLLQMTGHTLEQIMPEQTHWQQLTQELPTIDCVIFYVGGSKIENDIKAIHELGLPANKAIFVFCNCQHDEKMEILYKYGFSDSLIIRCECGGKNTMKQIMIDYHREGKILYK